MKREGKNLSDTIGSLTKMSFIRGMKKADIGVNDVSDVVEIMKLNLKSQTTQFKHFLINQIGACNRPSKVEVDNRAEPLKGISKFHSIWITEDEELRGSVLSCEDCTALLNGDVENVKTNLSAHHPFNVRLA